MNSTLLSEAACPPAVANAAPEARPSAPLCAAIAWPSLDGLGLGAEQKAFREAGIGGSDANIILSGDDERIRRLWREKRGEAQAEDLSGCLAVMLGCWTEEFNRQWYEKNTGYRVSRVNESLVSAEHDWRRCTLDGFVECQGAVWEAKHTSPFSKPEDLLARYMPQLQHNMAVAGAERALLSVIFGNSKWEVFEIASDWLYQEELLIAEARFWDSVRSGEPPVPAPIPPAPKPVGVREICLEGNNTWASAAVDWPVNRDAARIHAGAATELKALVEPDVKRAFGHGVEATRSKSGAITIKELRA